MSVRKKISSIGLLFVCISLVIVGLVLTLPVKAETKQVTTITFWYTENDAEKKGVTDLVAAFEAANPDIQVEALQKGFFDAKSLYISAFIAGNEPELFRAARDWVSEFAVAGMIAPVTSEFTQTDLDDFLPIALRYVTYPDKDGTDQIWGFPQLVDTPALMLNKHFFTEAGIDTSGYQFNTSWTWDEYLDVCNILYNTSAVEYATTLAGMFFGAQPIFFGHGAKMFRDGIVDINHIDINSTASRTSLEFLKDFVEMPYTPPWTEQGWTSLNPYFSDLGRVGMIAQGPWELKNFLENSPEFNPSVDDAKFYATADNLQIIQLPHDEFNNTGAPVGGQNYVISSFAGPKYEATVKLAKYLTTEETMAFKAKSYYHVPARKSVMNRTDVQAASSFPYVQGYYEAILNAYQTPVSNFWANLEEDFANQIDEYLADEIDLNQCIKQTIDLWKETLGQSVVTGTQPTDTTGYTETVPGFEFLLVVVLALPTVTIVFVYRKKRH
ncbi:MAG: extracellular solute-binding protein [Promethearchaeota archaeon]